MLRRHVYNSVGPRPPPALPNGDEEYSARTLRLDPPVQDERDLEHRAHVISRLVAGITEGLSGGLSATLELRRDPIPPDAKTETEADWQPRDLVVESITLDGSFKLRASNKRDEEAFSALEFEVEDPFDISVAGRVTRCDPFMVTTLTPALLVKDQTLTRSLLAEMAPCGWRLGQT